MKLHYDRLQYLYSAICRKSLIYPGVVGDNAYFIYFFPSKQFAYICFYVSSVRRVHFLYSYCNSLSSLEAVASGCVKGESASFSSPWLRWKKKKRSNLKNLMIILLLDTQPAIRSVFVIRFCFSFRCVHLMDWCNYKQRNDIPTYF